MNNLGTQINIKYYIRP